MRKQFISFMLLFLALSAILGSCVNKTGKAAGALVVDSILTNETEHLFGDTAKPACNLVINLSYIDNASEGRMKDSLNSYFLAASLGDEYIGMTPQEAVEKYKAEYVKSYREDLEELYTQEEKEYGDEVKERRWYNYYKYIDSHVQLYCKNLLVYRTRYEEYTGGAHGIYMTSFLNIDLRTLSAITLEDLFADGSEEALTELLWQQLMRDNGVTTRQEAESLGYGSTGELEPTENFHIGKNGITFYYNVYEVAPYVMGPVSVTLSYKVLDSLLDDRLEILDSVR